MKPTTHRRVKALAFGLAVCTTLIFWTVAVAAAAATTQRVSVSSAGVQGNGDSFDASVSAGGRYVAFSSAADNLVPGDTNTFQDVFVRDRVSGTTTRVSVSSGGAQANGASSDAVISADGNVVAFVSEASNLVPGDTNGGADIFVRDLAAGTTERVSVSSRGAQQDCRSVFDGCSEQVAISADGRFVAFSSPVSNLVPGDTNNAMDIFVRDRLLGRTGRVSVPNGRGGQANLGSFDPSISADGRFVAFDSPASNLVAGDTNKVGDVFVRDRSKARTGRVSISNSRAQGNLESGGPAISGDGRFVAFSSHATDLVRGDTNRAADVFLYERARAATTRVSVSTTAGKPTGIASLTHRFACPMTVDTSPFIPRRRTSSPATPTTAWTSSSAIEPAIQQAASASPRPEPKHPSPIRA
jgi:Tol biopolymer transport system component